MAKIMIVEYEPSHAALLAAELRDFEAEVIDMNADGGRELQAWCDHMSQFAVMGTFLAEDRVAAIFASLRVNTTTAEIWAFTGRAVDDNVREFWAACVRGLDSMIDTLGDLTRLQCHVDIRHVKSQAWVERLGFTCETPEGMKNYGRNDETFLLYSKLLGGRHG